MTSAPPLANHPALDLTAAECPVSAAIGALTAAVDVLIAADLGRLDQPGSVAALDAVETQARRLPVVRDGLVAELQRRDVAASHGARSTSAWLQDRFLLSTAEARTWLRGAERLTPRFSLTGEPLEPLLPAVAAARAGGTLSPAHVKVIEDLDDELPADLPTEQRQDIEAAMVGYAEQLDPRRLTRLGQRLLDAIDPDGTEPKHQEAHRRRGIVIGPLRHGLARISGHVDAWTREALLSVLASLSDPDPGTRGASRTAASRDGEGDVGGRPPPVPRTDDSDVPAQRPLDAGRRTRPQRMHDALRELCERLLASGQLPRRGGTPATILLTVPLATLEQRSGYVSTAHGGDIPTREVIRHAADATFIPIVLDPVGNPLYVGRHRRLATTSQRLALHVRDGGCVIPGCTTPSQDCQTHHLQDWAAGGPTDLGNLALLCSYHHHRIDRWTLRLRNGRIRCTAPPEMARESGPQVNRYFRGVPPDRLFQ